MKGSVKEPIMFHNYETEKITRKASNAEETRNNCGQNNPTTRYNCYASPLIGGCIKRRCCLTSVCQTSVEYIGPKSRTERPRKTKIGVEIAHVIRDGKPLSVSIGQRSRSPGRFTHRRTKASGSCSGQHVNVLLRCGRLGGASAPTEGGKGRGRIVSPCAQLVIKIPCCFSQSSITVSIGSSQLT